MMEYNKHFIPQLHRNTPDSDVTPICQTSVSPAQENFSFLIISHFYLCVDYKHSPVFGTAYSCVCLSHCIVCAKKTKQNIKTIKNNNNNNLRDQINLVLQSEGEQFTPKYFTPDVVLWLSLCYSNVFNTPLYTTPNQRELNQAASSLVLI